MRRLVHSDLLKPALSIVIPTGLNLHSIVERDWPASAVSGAPALIKYHSINLVGKMTKWMLSRHPSAPGEQPVIKLTAIVNEET